MTKQTPKKKFNNKARAQKPAATSIDTDAAMDAIDRAPDSFSAVIAFGHEPLERLGKLSNEMIKVQGQFNNEVNAVADSLAKLESGLQQLDLDKFGEATLRLLKGLANGNANNPSADEDNKLVADMQQSLPRLLDELVSLTDNLAVADKGLQKVLKAAETLADERKAISGDIKAFLGSSKEVLRRYTEQYIPEAQKQFNETHDPDDELYLKNVLQRKDDFVDRTMVLEATRLSATIAAQQLQQMVGTMEDQSKKIRDILDNSQNEWKAMLTAAGIAGTLQAAQGRNDNAPKAKPPSKKPKGPKH